MSDETPITLELLDNRLSRCERALHKLSEAQIKERFRVIEERQASDNTALHDLTRKVDLLMQIATMLAKVENNRDKLPY